MDASSFKDIKLLSDLLKPDQDESSDDEMPESGTSAYTPGMIGKSNKEKAKPSPYEKMESGDGGDIWADHEIHDMGWEDDQDEGKTIPEYEIKYKQKVGSEDIFLGMTGKQPSTAHCEDMVVQIDLPDAELKDMDLDIRDTSLDLRHPAFRLHLPLPHPVDSKLSRAEWLGSKQQLRVTLRLKREFDFINF